MLKFLAVASVGAIGLFSLPALSEQVPTKQSVVNECALVASHESSKKQDHSFAGRCLSATGLYLAALTSANLAPNELGSDLSALVVDLALLLRDRCVLNSEIAQAIALASSVSGDPDQKAQIKLVSVTISECDFGVTAAIPTPFTDGSTKQQASGRPASFS